MSLLVTPPWTPSKEDFRDTLREFDHKRNVFRKRKSFPRIGKDAIKEVLDLFPA